MPVTESEGCGDLQCHRLFGDGDNARVRREMWSRLRRVFEPHYLPRTRWYVFWLFVMLVGFQLIRFHWLFFPVPIAGLIGQVVTQRRQLHRIGEQLLREEAEDSRGP